MILAQSVNGLDAKLSEAFKRLHEAAASIADSKERYKATGDARFLASIDAVKPLYDYWLKQYNAIAKQLGQQEMPSDFLLSLDRVGDDAQKGLGATADLLKLALVVAAIGAVAYAIGQTGPLVRAVKSL